MIVNSMVGHQESFIQSQMREKDVKKDALTEKTEQIWDNLNTASNSNLSSRFFKPISLNSSEFNARGMDKRIECIKLLGPNEAYLFTEEGELISVPFKLPFSNQRECLAQRLDQSSIKLIRSSNGIYRIEAQPRLLGGGENPLHVAAKEGNTRLLTQLLENRSYSMEEKFNGNTPLHVACIAGQLEVVRILLAHGANANHEDPEGMTPLCSATSENFPEIARLLIAHGANVNCRSNGTNPLFRAVVLKHVAMVRLLVANGANVNITQNSSELTPLLMAIRDGNPDIVRPLILNGANVNYQDSDGVTPLYVASRNNYDLLVRILLLAGAKVSAELIDEISEVVSAKIIQLLEWGLKQTRFPLMRYQFQQGASLAERNRLSQTIAANKHTINNPDRDGNTPLLLATMQGKCDIMRLLIANGANVNFQRTTDGSTPLTLAAWSGHEECVRVLLTDGADVNIAIKNGNTALGAASQGNHAKIVQMLKIAGAQA